MIDDRDDDEDFTTVTTRAALAAAVATHRREQRPWVVVISGGAAVGRMVRIDRELVIGRGRVADLRLDEEGVSRQHAKIVMTPEGGVDVIDLESRNGTFVNGERASRAALRDGDKIQIGDATILKFSYQDALDEELQNKLFESATKDPLTNVANRRVFTETLAREVAFAKRHGTCVSVVTFDVDHFKRVNDTYGHAAGDVILAMVARVAESTLRAEDLLARIGGEEFAVVLRECSASAALACAERLRRAIADASSIVGAERLSVTISIGVSTFTGAHPRSPDELLAAADQALYRAKRGGRNRVVADGPIITRSQDRVSIAP